MQPYNIYLDMETGDPDDVFALLFLLCHPEFNLRGVSVVPGGPQQVGLVKHICQMFNHDIPIGAYDLTREKNSVSGFATKNFDFEPCQPDLTGWENLENMLQAYPDTVLITGGPLSNLGAWVEQATGSRIRLWAGQGGFAGTRVVPEPLEKFAGMETCPTFNFGANHTAARAALDCANIGTALLMSKDVCHGFLYTHEQHVKLKGFSWDETGFVYKLIGDYMAHKQIKAMHDLLPILYLLNSSIVDLARVDVLRERNGHWGSVANHNSRTWISVKLNVQKAWETFA